MKLILSFPLSACKDGELRTGDKANDMAHANWNVDTDKNQRKLSNAKDIKLKITQKCHLEALAQHAS